MEKQQPESTGEWTEADRVPAAEEGSGLMALSLGLSAVPAACTELRTNRKSHTFLTWGTRKGKLANMNVKASRGIPQGKGGLQALSTHLPDRSLEPHRYKTDSKQPS